MGVRMGISFPYLDNSSEDENEIKDDFKGNEISLISGISIFFP